MSIKDEINKRIKEEIENDPYNLGYKDMDDTQIKKALNVGFSVPQTIYTQMPPPINRILAGLENGPNSIVADTDITDAKAFIKP